jgi:hypothetical protein
MQLTQGAEALQYLGFVLAGLHGRCWCVESHYLSRILALSGDDLAAAFSSQVSNPAAAVDQLMLT